MCGFVSDRFDFMCLSAWKMGARVRHLVDWCLDLLPDDAIKSVPVEGVPGKLGSDLVAVCSDSREFRFRLYTRFSESTSDGLF